MAMLKLPNVNIRLGYRLAFFTSVFVILTATVLIAINTRFELQRGYALIENQAVGTARMLRRFAASYYHDLRIDELKVTLEDVLAGDDVAYAFILDGQDTMLVDGKDGVDRLFETIDDPLSRRARATGLTQTEISGNLIHVAEPVPFSKGDVGSIRLAISLEPMLRDTERERDRTILFGGAISILAVVASFVIARRMTNSLKQLSSFSEMIASGDFNQRIDVIRGDEIGDVARSFNKMAADLETSTREINRLAFFDSLTGTANRALFHRKLDEALSRANARRSLLAVLFLDLDRFKEINDTLGHPAGDVLLQTIAQRLSTCIADDSTLARLGGDEFAMVVQDYAADDIRSLCGEILARVNEPIDLAGHEAVIGASIGVAVYPDDGREAEELTRHADVALFQAKAGGRNMYRHFHSSMDDALRERKELERDLRIAITKGELEVHFQPLIEAMNDRIIGAEALMRWKHPSRGYVSPAVFIPVAEDSGLISDLGHWVLENACREAVHWGGLKVAVNLSPIQFRDAGLAHKVATCLMNEGLPAHLLELEITEGALLNDLAATRETLSNLKVLGVKIAIDDFGTGYSSLSYLRMFPFDKLKIDRSFVTELGKDPSAEPVVSAIVSLGQGLGMRVNVEGVETAAQASLLRQMGCDELQGYIYGKPMLPEAFGRFCRGTERDQADAGNCGEAL